MGKVNGADQFPDQALTLVSNQSGTGYHSSRSIEVGNKVGISSMSFSRMILSPCSYFMPKGRGEFIIEKRGHALISVLD
jgi:hypothetical protein